ncbi:hypothetical protein EV193_106200 [Herbihabitans rhizosphaerae]|uniref:Uncharacterized protein n=1 Tax=Herbihabitans rhizosphaerae TaxID=1872711 RepID=A0A4Q7KKH0_9PSEU|nr:hypothetical protein [Herbihabitans rhizosphaerae]RZS36965.1 hypothetical protein EV193_106200 [Herbihabitans rhizosphaerae]
MNDWIRFVGGPGQSAMGPGVVPLTAPLRDQAKRAADGVGTAALTGKCAPIVPGAGGSGFGQAGGFGPGGEILPIGAGLPGSGGLPPGAAGVPGGPAGVPTKLPTPNDLKKVQQVAQNLDIPLFPGAAALWILLPLLALGLVSTMTSGSAYATSGSPMPVWLRRAGGFVAGLARRLRPGGRA